MIIEDTSVGETKKAAPGQLPISTATQAALDTKVTGLAGDLRAAQIGVWRHEAELHLKQDGIPHDRAELEASLAKATFTGLVMDLIATGDRRRLTKVFDEFVDRLDCLVAAAKG
jgi:hypothetical protein